MKEKIHIVVTEVFQISLITYLLLLLAEITLPGFISNSFNVHYLLFIAAPCGAFATLTENSMSPPSTVDQARSGWEWYLVFVVSLIVGLILYINTRHLGIFSVILSAYIFLIGIVISGILQSDARQ